MRNFCIKADFDCLVLLNGNELGILEGGQLNCKVEGKFVLTFFPLNNKTLPYSCVISSENGKIRSSSNLCSVVELPMQNYELYFLPYSIQYNKPLLIKDEMLDTIIGELEIRIYNMEGRDRASQIQVLSKDKIMLDYQSTSCITQVNITSKYINNEYFILIQGAIEDYQYLLVLSVNQNVDVNLELVANQIEIHDDCIKTLSKCFDIHKHGRVHVYKVQNGKFYRDEEYLVIMNDNVKINADLVPYAFFEALQLKDIHKCREYLTEELNNGVDDEHLLSYFGQFQEVRQNIYTNDNSSVVLIYKNDDNYTSKICKLTMIDNKIDNIELID